jgi:hypothetical protein
LCNFSDIFRKKDMDSDSTLRSCYLSEGEHVVGLGMDFRVVERGRKGLKEMGRS